MHGAANERTLLVAINFAAFLVRSKLFAEATRFLRDQGKIANRELGPEHRLALFLAQNLSAGLQDNPDATRADLLEAEAIAEEVTKRRRRVLGATHPDTRFSEKSLVCVRERLARTEV